MTRRYTLHLLAAIGLAGVMLTVGPNADAGRRTRVRWSSIQLPTASKQAKHRQALFKKILRREARREKWGATKKVYASVKVTEFRIEHKKNVVRVTCAATGRLKGGPAVRTKFSFGDHPEQEKNLEKTVITLVARGLVTRLASVSRRIHPKRRSGKNHAHHR